MGKIVEQTKEIKLRRIPRLVREGSPHRTGKKPTKPAPEKTFEQMIKSLVKDWQLPPDVDAALEKFMDLADEYSGGEDNAKNIKAFNKAMFDVQSATKLRIQDKLVDLKVLDIPARSMAQQQIDRDAPFGPGHEKPSDPTARTNSAKPPKDKKSESRVASGGLFEPNNEYGNDIFQESFRDKTSSSPSRSSGGYDDDDDQGDDTGGSTGGGTNFDDLYSGAKSKYYRDMGKEPDSFGMPSGEQKAMDLFELILEQLEEQGLDEDRIFGDKAQHIGSLVDMLDLPSEYDREEVEKFIQDVRDRGF